jgi:hypothetical protein
MYLFPYNLLAKTPGGGHFLLQLEVIIATTVRRPDTLLRFQIQPRLLDGPLEFHRRVHGLHDMAVIHLSRQPEFIEGVAVRYIEHVSNLTAVQLGFVKLAQLLLDVLESLWFNFPTFAVEIQEALPDLFPYFRGEVFEADADLNAGLKCYVHCANPVGC